MIRVYHKHCGWYFQWKDKDCVLQDRGPWETKELAEEALKDAIAKGIVT